MHKDYKCVDQIVELAGKRALRVKLKTKEFGTMCSKSVVKELKDPASDCILWNSLANDLIDEYEDRLNHLANS